METCTLVTQQLSYARDVNSTNRLYMLKGVKVVHRHRYPQNKRELQRCPLVAGNRQVQATELRM